MMFRHLPAQKKKELTAVFVQLSSLGTIWFATGAKPISLDTPVGIAMMAVGVTTILTVAYIFASANRTTDTS